MCLQYKSYVNIVEKGEIAILNKLIELILSLSLTNAKKKGNTR